MTDDILLNCRHIQISQILLNLIVNSVDAVKKLDQRWIKLFVFTEDEKVVFLLSDSGAGISEEVIANIFKPFYTTKEIGAGTGLGMSVSKQIAMAHSGNLSYQEINGNTGFRLELPLVANLS